MIVDLEKQERILNLAGEGEEPKSISSRLGVGVTIVEQVIHEAVLAGDARALVLGSRLIMSTPVEPARGAKPERCPECNSNSLLAESGVCCACEVRKRLRNTRKKKQ